MARLQHRKGRRVMRHKRVRRKIIGTSERPRLSIFRSLNHLYAQVIDDQKGSTIASASTVESVVRQNKDGQTKSEMSKTVGSLIAQRATGQGVSKVVFDRGGYKYHGRVKNLAEAARGGGLEF